MITAVKPKAGDNNNESPISCALLQLIPCPPCIQKKPIPAPRMEPIRVCELEQGIPRYQVARFQEIAAMRTARTTVIFSLCDIIIISPTGNRLIILIATAIPPSQTPRKFQIPDQITAVSGFRDFV